MIICLRLRLLKTKSYCTTIVLLSVEYTAGDRRILQTGKRTENGNLLIGIIQPYKKQQKLWSIPCSYTEYQQRMDKLLRNLLSIYGQTKWVNRTQNPEHVHSILFVPYGGIMQCINCVPGCWRGFLQLKHASLHYIAICQ